MQAEEGGDWSALLCNRNPESFVDVYSPQDNYPTKTLGDEIRRLFFFLEFRNPPGKAGVGVGRPPDLYIITSEKTTFNKHWWVSQISEAARVGFHGARWITKDEPLNPGKKSQV